MLETNVIGSCQVPKVKGRNLGLGRLQASLERCWMVSEGSGTEVKGFTGCNRGCLLKNIEMIVRQRRLFRPWNGGMEIKYINAA
ncbi:MAG: hypothetical protein ACTS53_01585 [Candidatus Hodgkinia cicadicola]